MRGSKREHGGRDARLTIPDVAPCVAVNSPGIDLLNVPPQLQRAPLLDSAIHAAARPRAPTVRATLHVPPKTVALRLESGLLQPACNALLGLLLCPSRSEVCECICRCQRDDSHIELQHESRLMKVSQKNVLRDSHKSAKLARRDAASAIAAAPLLRLELPLQQLPVLCNLIL